MVQFLETSKDLKKLSVFMRGIEMPEKYKEHTIGGIIATPVKGFRMIKNSGILDEGFVSQGANEIIKKYDLYQG